MGECDTPLDLTPLGMPGCPLLAAPQVALLLQNSGGIASAVLPIPAATSLLGAAFYAQGIVTDQPANALGVVVSNGYQLTLGAK